MGMSPPGHSSKHPTHLKTSHSSWGVTPGRMSGNLNLGAVTDYPKGTACRTAAEADLLLSGTSSRGSFERGGPGT